MCANDTLAHHGVQGQQWGVKHGPPYPIQKGNGVTIRKGTKFSRLSIHDEQESKGHAYVTYNKSDKDRYKGFFGLRLSSAKAKDHNAKIYVHEIEAAMDMKSPSQQERIKTFTELYKNDPNVGKELARYATHTKDGYSSQKMDKSYNKNYANLEGDAIKTVGYNTFVAAIGGNKYLRDVYFNELRKRGYTFIRDDLDSGKQAVEPSIILDRELSTVYKSVQELPMSEVFSNLKKYGFFLDKKDRHKSWES